MHKALIGLAAGAGFAVIPMSTAALECPVLHPIVSPWAMTETAADVTRDGRLLSADAPGGAIRQVISRLRDAHPNASNAEIQNYLLTAFCPSLVQRGFDDTETMRMLRAFTSAVEAQLWRSQG